MYAHCGIPGENKDQQFVMRIGYQRAFWNLLKVNRQLFQAIPQGHLKISQHISKQRTKQSLVYNYDLKI